MNDRRPILMRFATRERIGFAQRLGMLLTGGISLPEALALMRDEAQSTSARYVFSQLFEGVSSGSMLSSAMEELDIFDVFAIGMVRIGETSGTLPENMLYVAEEIRRVGILRRLIIGSLIYPAIILAATIAMSLSITVYIFPKIAPIFLSFKHVLPFSTRIVIAISSMLIHHWVAIICSTAAAIFASVSVARIPKIRMALDMAVLKLPVIRTFSRTYNLALTARVLGTLSRGGISLVEALTISASVLSNGTYRAALNDISRDVERGHSISHAMRHDRSHFPPDFTQMIAAGERTGDLQTSFSYLADVYEADLIELTSRMTTLVEPILMIIMGLIVGTIAISIIAPIYGITQDLGTYH